MMTGKYNYMNDKLVYDLVVIGGGPAGLAAAVQFRESCGGSVIVLERNETLGGILPQCIHDGFGLYEFGRQMTGPEYAQAWIERATDAGVECIISCDALEMRRVGAPGALKGCSDGGLRAADDAGARESADDAADDKVFEIKIISPETGPAVVTAGAVVMATGCRERTRGGLRIPGSRPAGVYTAGQIQYMMNIKNLLPGRSAVILGSGDIGLIMARRMKWEGIDVKLILGQQASGLIRNYMQCVRDWDIPLRFGYTVVSVHGRKRVTGVTVAPAGADGEPDLSRKKYIRCDMLVVAAGLIAETEVWKTLFTSDGCIPEAIESDDETATQEAGVFVCGNTVRQYDTVDEVSVSGRRAGHRAALYLAAGGRFGEGIAVDAAKEFPFPAAGVAKHVITEEDMAYLSGERGIGGDDADGQQDGRGDGVCDIIYCINCPRGCRMNVSLIDDTAHASPDNIKVTGNACPAGERYAVQELSSPMRVVTTTVAVKGDKTRLIPVRTSAPVPKERVSDVLKLCRKIKAELPVKTGQVLYDNEGVKIIVCADMYKKAHNNAEEYTDKRS